jgi:proline iminopeptidase
LRQALGLARVNLFGQSFGGMVAQANNDSCNNEIRNHYPEVWDELQRLRAKGLRSSAREHQKLYYGVPLGLFYFHDASKAALLPHEEGSNDVYYAVAGDDADFKVGGDIAALDF